MLSPHNGEKEEKRMENVQMLKQRKRDTETAARGKPTEPTEKDGGIFRKWRNGEECGKKLGEEKGNMREKKEEEERGQRGG